MLVWVNALQEKTTNMSSKEKPLPKPPNTAFGRKKQFEQSEEQASLLADRMAAAMAEGKLEEFLKKEMPDNEYARNLATMMMGMTGMMPGDMQAAAQPPTPNNPATVPAKGEPGQTSPSQEIPEDVKAAIMSGNANELIGLLRREHHLRNPDTAQGTETPGMPAGPESADAQPSIDKDLIDALIQIAKDNSVTLDWMILRAIKVYVEEYRKTGKL